MSLVVEARLDKLGHLHVQPIKEKYRKNVLFIQFDVDDFIESYVPRQLHRDLNEGWTVLFSIDPEAILEQAA